MITFLYLKILFLEYSMQKNPNIIWESSMINKFHTFLIRGHRSAPE